MGVYRLCHGIRKVYYKVYYIIMMSSLQVVGHMFARPIVHDLVASSVAEKAQAKELVDSIVGESLEHMLILWVRHIPKEVRPQSATP